MCLIKEEGVEKLTQKTMDDLSAKRLTDYHKAKREGREKEYEFSFYTYYNKAWDRIKKNSRGCRYTNNSKR